MTTLTDFTRYDMTGVLWFFFVWIGYTIYSDRYGAARGNLIGSMARRRADWMKQMLGRENRIVDVQIVRSLLHNATFFASTSILILAGLITLLGSTQQAIDLVTDLPITQKTSRQLWEIKVLMLGMVFVYAFFKFGWAMRQLSYCSILIGAATPPGQAAEHDVQAARDTARVASLAANHSNRGIRAYYFGLALLSWFLHPLALVPATAWVAIVLYRREFRSRISQLLQPPESHGAHRR